MECPGPIIDVDAFADAIFGILEPQVLRLSHIDHFASAFLNAYTVRPAMEGFAVTGDELLFPNGMLAHMIGVDMLSLGRRRPDEVRGDYSFDFFDVSVGGVVELRGMLDSRISRGMRTIRRKLSRYKVCHEVAAYGLPREYVHLQADLLASLPMERRTVDCDQGIVRFLR